jgi:hypothetical protein
MKLATAILQLLAFILLFCQTLTPTAPYQQRSCLGRLLDSSWHLSNPVTLADLPWDNTPTSLCSSTITAAYNNTQPNHTNIPDVIHPVVVPANTSTFNRSNTLLLSTMTLHSVSLENIPCFCSSTIKPPYNITQPNHTNIPDVIHPVVVPANISSYNNYNNLLLYTMTLHSVSLENIPCFCSSTFTAAYNNTQPNHTDIPDVIHPVVVPAIISSFNCSNTLLLYTMTLHLVSLKNIPCLCSSTITAASNNTQPNRTNIPNVIHPVVVPANISSFNCSNTLLLNTMTLHSVSLKTYLSFAAQPLQLLITTLNQTIQTSPMSSIQ